jgi:branched-chain amino acid transport system substrate-binding protein
VIGRVAALLFAGASAFVYAQPSSVIPRDSGWTGPEESRSQEDEPYRKPPRAPLDFPGPGREEPEPDVDEVVLGWFGPGDPDHPDFGDPWRGATLALEQENAAGGYRGKPFRLLPAWSESPWKAGIADLTRLVYDRQAWAVIGGVDGTTTHLAVQISLKSHFLLLSPGSTDASADHANVPWLFSLPPSDARIAPVLADAVARAAAAGPFVLAAATDHDSHATLVAVRREMASRRLMPATLVEFAAVEPDIALVAARLVASRPRAVLVLAPSRTAGRLVAAVRGTGFDGTILGGAPAGRTAFRRAAGAAAEDVIAPLLVEPGPAWEAFAQAYATRWGEPPDEAGAHGYDAVRLVAAAVRKAGLNRALARDAVRALAPWAGASGAVSWNALGRNERPVALGSWVGARFRVVREP